MTKERKDVFLLSTHSYSLHIISDIKGLISKNVRCKTALRKCFQAHERRKQMCLSAVDLGHSEKTLINAETQAVKSSEARINWP